MLLDSWFSHKVDIIVRDLRLSLCMSTVIGLADLAEDEIIARPLPMEVMVKGVHIKLIEDRPPVNITSPGPVPINLAIGEMKVMRDRHGVFHIQPDVATAFRSEQIDLRNGLRVPEREKEILSLQLILKQLKQDREVLRMQLAASKQQQETTK